VSHPGTAKTRRSLHAVAELVLAGPQHRRTGAIKLIVTPTGLQTFTGPALTPTTSSTSTRWSRWWRTAGPLVTRPCPDEFGDGNADAVLAFFTGSARRAA
jgi:hypothetical protein